MGWCRPAWPIPGGREINLRFDRAMSGIPEVLSTLGATGGVIAALWLVVRLNRNLPSYSGLRVARDVTLLVVGSLAGLLAIGGMAGWAG